MFWLEERRKWAIGRIFGELLGIDIESGEYATFGGAGGGIVEVFIHKVILKLGEDVLEARVAFCKKHESKTPNVLGRLDLFDMKFILKILTKRPVLF